MNDLVSVIVPVYNAEKYVGECLESIINQSYKHLEIIVVDDGSTDGSSKICDEYALQDNRIQVIHQVNCGQSSARNVGIAMCSGKYITFVDSDDYINPIMVEKLMLLAVENGFAMCDKLIAKECGLANCLNNRDNKCTRI